MAGWRGVRRFNRTSGNLEEKLKGWDEDEDIKRDWVGFRSWLEGRRGIEKFEVNTHGGREDFEKGEK